MASTRTADLIGVFVAPESGVRPTASDYDPNMIAVNWSVVAGSGLWRATLVPNLGREKRRIVNKSVTFNGNRQVEIWLCDANEPSSSSSFRKRLLFWGEMLGLEIRIEDGAEQEVIRCAMLPYHFGNVVDGQVVSYAGDEYTVPIPIEFNPQIDGKVIDNRFKPTGNTDDEYFWIDPESVRTDGAKTFQDGTVATWDLATAIESLCIHFNPSETNIANASHDAVTSALSTAPVIKNAVLKFGDYLPAYLDALCQQYGHGWVVDCKAITDTGSTHYPEQFPEIRFFTQQDGYQKTATMQYPGEIINLDQTNTFKLGMSCDLGNLKNVIYGYGALIEREFTIPLYRTWPTTDDGNEDHEDPSNPIGRKWAANEAGDYFDETGEPIREEMFAFVPWFGENWIPKRRVLEDCLTFREDQTHRRPVFIEYREDGEAEWKPVPNEWGYRVLHDEVGIWFTGQRESGGTTGGIPEDMLTDDVQLRATGTLRGDTRVEYKTAASVASPNSNQIQETIDLSDRYFDRRRTTTSDFTSFSKPDFSSILEGTQDEKDDAEALQTYIEEVQDKTDLADAQAELTLIGLRFCFDENGYDDAYKIGDIITKLEGREISFNRAASPVGAKYLQVVGIEWTNEPGNQTTILQLSPTGVS